MIAQQTREPEEELSQVCAVIIAAHSAARWIESCLASWAAVQVPAGWTVDLRIGVDGCPSTARSLTRMGVHYRYSEHNVGPYLIRNSLIAASPADAFAIFDADDMVDPGYLTALLPLAGDGGIAGPARRTLKGDRIVHRNFPYASGVCVISGAAWTRLGGYRPWRMAADHDFIQRARALGIQVQSPSEPLYTRRQHHANITQQSDTGLWSKARAELKRESAHLIAEAKGPHDLRVNPETVEFQDNADT